MWSSLKEMKKVLITGIGGQDGSYLAEHLLSLGYEVHGIVRRISVAEHQESRVDHLSGKIKTHYGDLLDISSLERVVKLIQPDEVYNLGAQSHVRISFDIPQFTVQTNALGTLNLLEVCRHLCPKAHIYQASSSEMFGNSIQPGGIQGLKTPMHPVSPYGCAKLFSFHICRTYRESYGMFISSGILFNHESPRRGSNFVTSKVVKGAVRIKMGLDKELVLGNLDSHRDWGHSRDYVKAMHLILNYPESRDWIISTGKTRSIRDMCKYVFEKLGMNYKDYVKQDERYLRPNELNYLKGDSEESRKLLDWNPETSFEELMNEMIEHWMKIYSS
jgi:GDPmannose 4,6-dehydratase